MDFFSFLPDFQLMRILSRLFNVIFNQDAVITDSKPDKNTAFGPLGG